MQMHNKEGGYLIYNCAVLTHNAEIIELNVVYILKFSAAAKVYQQFKT
jgi:hypothetical protein